MEMWVDHGQFLSFMAHGLSPIINEESEIEK